VTGREWKPGDIAVVTEQPATIGAQREAFVAVKDDKGWFAVDPGVGWFGNSDIVDARPLVLIDPEDREQVERLANAIWAYRGNIVSDLCSATEHGLREFANPTPPKPEEPLGLGAVVVDAEGRCWVRDTDNPGELNWLSSPRGISPKRSRYATIAAVKVLSEGVTA
jgi:hypothetical protein